MRKNVLSTLVGLFVFVVGCLMFSCQRESNGALLTEKKTVQSDAYTSGPCADCYDVNLYKSAGDPKIPDPLIGNLRVCQPTATEITFTFTVDDELDVAWFNKIGVAIDPTGENFTKLNPSYVEVVSANGDKVRQLSYTIDWTTLTKTVNGEEVFLVAGDIICIAGYAVIPGPDGGGGQIWAGNEAPADLKNKLARSFCYTIKQCNTETNPNANCTFTQGYWFAKPGTWLSGKGKTKIASGVHWPGNTENDGFWFAGYPYTYAQARAIFFGTNSKKGKTDAKQAFLQGLALKLSMNGNPEEPCEGTADALARIEAFLNSSTAWTNESLQAISANDQLRADAALISSCLSAPGNHCDNTPATATN